MKKRIIFSSNGPLDKNLMGTAVVASLKDKYPDHEIVVLSNFPDVWLHNPNVYRVYKPDSAPYFYDDYVLDKDALIFAQDPFHADSFLQGKKHLIDSWSELCGVNTTFTQPSIYFTQREKEVIKRRIVSSSSKPIFLIQTHSNISEKIPYYWPKDMPSRIANSICENMHKRGYRIIHITTGKEQSLPFAENVRLPLRQLLCLIGSAERCFFINSFALHTSMAQDVNSTIFWVADSPKVFGYKSQKNVLPQRNSALESLVNKKMNYPMFSLNSDDMSVGIDEHYNVAEIVKTILL